MKEVRRAHTKSLETTDIHNELEYLRWKQKGAAEVDLSQKLPANVTTIIGERSVGETGEAADAGHVHYLNPADITPLWQPYTGP